MLWPVDGTGVTAQMLYQSAGYVKVKLIAGPYSTFQTKFYQSYRDNLATTLYEQSIWNELLIDANNYIVLPPVFAPKDIIVLIWFNQSICILR